VRGPGMIRCAVRRIFSNSAIRWFWCADAGRVHDHVIAVACGAACRASNNTAAGSPPVLVRMTFGPSALSPNFKLLDGGARKVSAAHSSTVLPWERKTCDSLPMVVVFPCH